MEKRPSFPSRIGIALAAFWRILFDAELAAAVRRLRQAGAGGAGMASPAAVEPPPLKEPLPEAALQLLGLLQQHGRFVDFLEEEVTHFADAEVGAAARVVHEGCRKALYEHLHIEPVRSEEEGARVTLQEGFDASCVRLTGNVVGQPPFTGRLAHRGWRVTTVKLPKLASGHDVTVLAPAEVEL